MFDYVRCASAFMEDSIGKLVGDDVVDSGLFIERCLGARLFALFRTCTCANFICCSFFVIARTNLRFFEGFSLSNMLMTGPTPRLGFLRFGWLWSPLAKI